MTETDAGMAGAFYALWKLWSTEDEPRSRTVEEELARDYRRAWASGDVDDRVAVLYFIFLRRDADGFDLILEGLKSDESRIARAAAAVASAFMFEGLDLGPTIRMDLEHFGQRFPEEVTGVDLAYSVTAVSFSSLHEIWYEIDQRRNRTIESQLAAEYRRAWGSGDSAVCDTVLRYILQWRKTDGFDLVIEGLKSDAVDLAKTAAAVASALLFESFDLGPTIRKDLEDFGRRFPQWDAFSWAALQALDRNERRES